jgi:hypothetical protein
VQSKETWCGVCFCLWLLVRRKWATCFQHSLLFHHKTKTLCVNNVLTLSFYYRLTYPTHPPTYYNCKFSHITCNPKKLYGPTYHDHKWCVWINPTYHT